MLRINLLPPYIYDKQKKIKLAVLWAAIVAAALGVFLLWFVSLNKTLSERKAEQAASEELKSQYDTVDQNIKKEMAARADIEKRQTFIANAQTYNDSWPAAFETMRDVTADNILLKSLAFSKDRKTVSLTGFAKTEEDIVKWWMYLRNNYAGPDATLPFDNVSFSLPAHPYDPKTAATTQGGPGAPGGKGGFPGSGAPSAAGISSGGGGGGFPGSGGFAGGGGGNKDAVGPGMIEGRPGINFTASITLKKPLAPGIATAPVWSAGGAPATPAGFGGGPGSGGGAPTSGGSRD
jgi:Tfp pilus assembly protein PilN